MGIVNDGQRFDERCVVKEDYDFSLQSLLSHKAVLRILKYWFKVPHLTGQSGGCAAYRTMQVEYDAVAYLKRKWGSGIIGTNPKKDWEIVVRPPLKGI